MDGITFGSWGNDCWSSAIYQTDEIMLKQISTMAKAFQIDIEPLERGVDTLS
jgi:hypothetical protein